MWQMAIMAAGSLLSSGGQAYGASQAIKQGKYQRDILGYASDYQAALVKIDQAKLDRVRDQTISAQTAQTAASGIRTDVGAPLELRAETEILSDIDKHILRTAGGIENLRYGIAGHASMAQGYGTGSAMYARGLSYLVNSGSYMASRYATPTKNETLLKSTMPENSPNDR
jgi:hypothetical protein